ncbi:MAG: hypothetical protein HYW49_06720 [Deltaproteobacteria bacterium]|nr:hypothetical protein [Deltaproteobacteria bacterium]
MASYLRRKEALRAAIYAFVAGSHCVTEEVEKMHALVYGGLASDSEESRSARIEMLTQNFERFLNSPDVADLFVGILNEEDLYPFGTGWKAGALGSLLSKLVAPPLSFAIAGRASDPTDAEIFTDADGFEFSLEPAAERPSLKFRFRKGYKKLLNELPETLACAKTKPASIDHWLVAVINTSFHAGMNVAAQVAENAKAYYPAILEIENEEEPWNRYPQILMALNRQLRRETRKKTGLISDLDL